MAMLSREETGPTATLSPSIENISFLKEKLKSKVALSLPEIDSLDSKIKAGALALYQGKLGEGPLPRLGGVSASILAIPLKMALTIPGGLVGIVTSFISAAHRGHIRSIKDIPEYILHSALFGFGLPFACGFVMLGTNFSELVNALKAKQTAKTKLSIAQNPSLQTPPTQDSLSSAQDLNIHTSSALDTLSSAQDPRILTATGQDTLSSAQNPNIQNSPEQDPIVQTPPSQTDASHKTTASSASPAYRFTDKGACLQSNLTWDAFKDSEMEVLLLHKKQEGSYVIYQDVTEKDKNKRNVRIAYYLNDTVVNRVLRFPQKTIEGLTIPLEPNKENEKIVWEAKMTRRSNAIEASRRLKIQLQDAEKFQNEEDADNAQFNALQQFPEPVNFSQDKEAFLGNLSVAKALCKTAKDEDRSLANTIAFQVAGRTYQAQLLAVFDGHGGAECAEYLRTSLEQKLTAKLQECNQEALTQEGIYNALKLTLFEIDRDYEMTGRQDGSTATVALVIERKKGIKEVWCANTGDSRTLLEQNGTALAMSEDAESQRKKFKQQIEDKGIPVVPRIPGGTPRVAGVLAVARAVGDASFGYAVRASPKITRRELKKGQIYRLILTSDGLTDQCSNRQIAEATYRKAQQGKNIADIAGDLVKAAYAAESENERDDITVLIASLTG